MYCATTAHSDRWQSHDHIDLGVLAGAGQRPRRVPGSLKLAIVSKVKENPGVRRPSQLLSGMGVAGIASERSKVTTTLKPSSGSAMEYFNIYQYWLSCRSRLHRVVHPSARLVVCIVGSNEREHAQQVDIALSLCYADC